MENQLLASEAVQAELKAKPGKRRRGFIYKDRQVVSLRLPDGLHTDLLAFADEQQVVLNTYILGLVEADLAERRKLSRAKVGKN
jgi:predicted HicB family RNase H-like nuclease